MLNRLFALTVFVLSMLTLAAAADELPVPTAAKDDWPWWRGPGRNNIAAPDQDPPTTWSETENVLWRVKLPGRGHATPCLVGDRLFVPAADKDSIYVLGLDRDTGKETWRTVVYEGEMAKIHKHNSYASATCAFDGERLFFPYQTPGAVRLAALSPDGKILWDREATPYKSVQGFSASPTLHGASVIVATDGGEGAGPFRLTAFDRATGKTLWQVERYTDESYASPLAIHVAGRDQLLIIGPDNTRSYAPGTGELLWECEGPTKYCAATVAFSPDTVFATAGYPRKALHAIRADGSGNVTGTHLKWKSDRKAGYVPSPLYSDGLVYAVNDKGLMRCYDAGSGAIVWEHDTKAPFYSSPVLVDDRLYVFDREGKGYVFQAGRTFKLLATNTLPSGTFATPVISRSRIYLRTLGDFFCLGVKR